MSDLTQAQLLNQVEAEALLNGAAGDAFDTFDVAPGYMSPDVNVVQSAPTFSGPGAPSLTVPLPADFNPPPSYTTTGEVGGPAATANAYQAPAQPSDLEGLPPAVTEAIANAQTAAALPPLGPVLPPTTTGPLGQIQQGVDVSNAYDYWVSVYGTKIPNDVDSLTTLATKAL